MVIDNRANPQKKRQEEEKEGEGTSCEYVCGTNRNPIHIIIFLHGAMEISKESLYTWELLQETNFKISIKITEHEKFTRGKRGWSNRLKGRGCVSLFLQKVSMQEKILEKGTGTHTAMRLGLKDMVI